jgi:hypothetical protein
MATSPVTPSHDLQNRTAEILQRVVPVSERLRWIPAPELIRQLRSLGADQTGLLAELRQTLTDTTDDLRW